MILQVDQGYYELPDFIIRNMVLGYIFMRFKIPNRKGTEIDGGIKK